MAQNVNGFRAIFSSAPVYNLAQRMVGAEKARRILVRDYFPDSGPYRMLDIGCGTAEILRHLPDSIDYHGFDASEAYIDEATRRFGNRGTFKAELVREASLEQIPAFDVILAFGLLHHLSDEEARMLFSLASKALKPNGRLITIDPTYADKQNPFGRWVISKDRGQNVRTPSAYAQLADGLLADITVDVRHDLLNIPYTHTVMVCSR